MTLCAHVPCYQCEYDLFGCDTAGVCPECATSIRSSLDPARLLFVPPNKLKPILGLLRIWSILAVLLLVGWFVLLFFQAYIFILPTLILLALSGAALPILLSLRCLKIASRMGVNVLVILWTLVALLVLAVFLGAITSSSLFSERVLFLVQWAVGLTPLCVFLGLEAMLSQRLPRRGLAYGFWIMIVLLNTVTALRIPGLPFMQFQWSGTVLTFASPAILMASILLTWRLVKHLSRTLESANTLVTPAD